jgi:hypothetical protein
MRLVRLGAAVAATVSILVVTWPDSAAVQVPVTVATVTVAPAAGVWSNEKPVTVVPRWRRQADRYADCISWRESRDSYRSRNHVAFGRWQFTRQSWDVTAARAGRLELVGVRPDRATPRSQDAMYYAAWSHGNGFFYWSSRWSGPGGYACWPGDTKPMRVAQ